MATINNFWAYMRNLFDDDGLFKDFPYPFKRIWLDPVNGSDSYDGLSKDKAKLTLDGTNGAYNACTTGKNDTIILVGNGASTGTLRLDAAFTWAKNATHFVGMCPPNSKSLRARIAPTAATTAFANFFTMTGNGCYFKNLQFYHGFATGAAASIDFTINGGDYNRFENVHFAGMGDAASAQSATSRALKLISADENEFINCTVGLDTIARTVANSLIEFATGCARNRFIDCEFPAWTTTVQTQTDIYGAAAGLDRYTEFEHCKFYNARKSVGYLVQTAVAELAALAGGDIVFKDCTLVGRTGFGKDATTRTFLLIDGGPPVAATTGLAVAPTA